MGVSIYVVPYRAMDEHLNERLERHITAANNYMRVGELDKAWNIMDEDMRDTLDELKKLKELALMPSVIKRTAEILQE